MACLNIARKMFMSPTCITKICYLESEGHANTHFCHNPAQLRSAQPYVPYYATLSWSNMSRPSTSASDTSSNAYRLCIVSTTVGGGSGKDDESGANQHRLSLETPPQCLTMGCNQVSLPFTLSFLGVLLPSRNTASGCTRSSRAT